MSLELPDFAEIEKALRLLADPRWLEKTNRLGIEVLHQAMADRIEAIERETPFSRASLSGRYPRSTPAVQGLNFGRDTGRFHDSWLESLSFNNGELVFETDLDYAIVQQEIVAVKSPFSDGYLGISEPGLDKLEEAIAQTAEEIFLNQR